MSVSAISVCDTQQTLVQKYFFYPYVKVKMLEIFMVVMVVMLVVALCLHHHSMKKKLDETEEQDSSGIRKAAEYSIMASNTVNPVIALVEVTKAVQIITSLHERYGAEATQNITKINTIDMLHVLQDQKDRILRDVIKHNPSFLPPHHPFNEEAGFIKKPKTQNNKASTPV